MSFIDTWQHLDWQRWQHQLAQVQEADVARTLEQRERHPQQSMSVAQLVTLLSPAAKPYLEAMATMSAKLTRQRFGHTMRMFVPLYLSNLCANDCSYCGFSMANAIKRKTLSMQALAEECAAIQALGFDSVLLVAGEHEKKVGVDYFADAIAVVRRYFNHVALEVQPLASDEYARLRDAGLAAVYVYQETYHESAYLKHHLRGKKRDIAWRLSTPERIAQAGVDKIGLGVLLGLADWRSDALACASHLRYMQRVGWRQRYAMAFPRLRPCAGGIEVEHALNDAELVQLICAFRIFEPDLEMSLSTRESVWLRDNLMPLGITHMSAGSKTQPGGYADQSIALEQFATDDNRSPQAVAGKLLEKGLEPVWKDWQLEFS